MTAQQLLTLVRAERLSPSAAAMLIELASPSTQILSNGTLAKRLRCTPTNVTTVGDTLVSRCLVRRHKSTNPREDRRITGYSATEEGLALLARHSAQTQATDVA